MPSWLYPALHTITDIGDSAELSAIVFVVTAYLLKCGCRREAKTLAGSFLITATLIGIIKFTALICGSANYYFSPSGHSALSTVVFGICAMLMSSRLKKWHRYIPAIFTVSLVAVIAISRILLGYHNVSEVITGLLIGSGALLIVWKKWLYRNETPPFDMRILMLLVCVSAWIFHGIHMPAEIEMQLFAARIKKLF